MSRKEESYYFVTFLVCQWQNTNKNIKQSKLQYIRVLVGNNICSPEEIIEKNMRDKISVQILIFDYLE